MGVRLCVYTYFWIFIIMDCVCGFTSMITLIIDMLLIYYSAVNKLTN